MTTLRKILMLLVFLSFATAIAAAPVEQIIKDELIAMYDLDTAWYELELLSCSLNATELASEELTLKPLSQKEPQGLFSLRAIVTRDGRRLESGQVTLRIRRFDQVLVLFDRIKSHELMEVDDFVRQRMDVTTLREQPVKSFEALVGNRARRNLRRGDILTTGDMEPIPDVESGRDVSIVYTVGACRITAGGKAMQSGVAGDYVRVKNKSSGKVIIARVVDETAVAVDP